MGVEIEGIVHRPRRMVGRNVQRLEVMEIVLDLRPLGDREADPGEECLDARQGAAERMAAAGPLPPPWQRHVNRLARQPGIQRRRFQRRLACGDGGFQRLLSLVDGLAGVAPLFGRQAPQFLEALGERAFLAQIMHARLIQGGEIAGPGDGGLGGLNQFGQWVHAG